MKYLSIVKYVLLFISILSVAAYFLGIADVDVMLIWAYILLGISVVSVILLPLINIIQNPQGAMRSLIGLLIVLVVLGITYAFAGDAAVTLPDGSVVDNSAVLKLSDMGLFSAYLAMVVAIASAVIGEIMNAFK